jgi:hypothetical protein
MRAELGYAADGRGRGVAYARLQTGAVIREPIRLRAGAAHEREAGYAAVAAIAATLKKRGFRRIELALPDRELIEDMDGQRTLPETLVLAYVRVRCTLNQFERYAFEHTAAEELMQRARAEVALHVAA